MEPTPTSSTQSTLATPAQLAAGARRNYVLEQLGVEALYSVKDAPGAAPAMRVYTPLVAEHDAGQATLSASAPSAHVGTADGAHRQPRDSSQIAALRAGLARTPEGKSQSAQKDSLEEVSRSELVSTQTNDEPAVSFQLLIAATGRWLWVERLSAGLIRKDQLQLIQAMGRAIDGPRVSIKHVQFDWPMLSHPQLPQDLSAAKQSVAGQLQRLAREASASGLVLLGESTGELVSEALSLTRITLPATTDMLQMPGLKRDAWHVLRHHVASD